MRIQITSLQMITVGMTTDIVIRHDTEVSEIGEVACIQNDERIIPATRINLTSVQCTSPFMRTGNHTLRLVDISEPSRFTSNYVFVQVFPVVLPEVTIRDKLPRLSTSDLEMKVTNFYPLRVSRHGVHNISVNLGGILSENLLSLHCLVRDSTGYFTTLGRLMILNSQLVICEFNLNLQPGDDYYLQISPNGY